MDIAIVGTGYVGLVTGVCLAAKGHRVTVLDVREDVVADINRGLATIHESGLPELLRDVVRSGNLQAKIAAPESLGNAQLVFICVGTPSTNGALDLSQIAAAAQMVGNWLRATGRFASIVVKSTVLPGTTDTFVADILERVSGKKLSRGEFGLGMNPEFLREGEAIGDFNKPDRIVFGHEDKKTLSLLEKTYASWSCEKIAVNTRTAEMTKYANNCLLALQISAVNELANVAAAKGGIDFMDVVRGISLDKRWNPLTADRERVYPEILSYLLPGCGFGGSCFPKDVEAMRTLSTSVGVKPRILQAILDTNESQPRAVLEPLLGELGADAAGKKVLLLGLAFKPGTDDVRESASLKIARHLTECGISVLAHDPIALPAALRAAGPDVFDPVVDWKGCLAEVNAVVVATKWPEYAELKSYAAMLRGKPILDCRRFLLAADFPESIFITVGSTNIRSSVKAAN